MNAGTAEKEGHVLACRAPVVSSRSWESGDSEMPLSPSSSLEAELL